MMNCHRFRRDTVKRSEEPRTWLLDLDTPICNKDIYATYLYDFSGWCESSRFNIDHAESHGNLPCAPVATDSDLRASGALLSGNYT